MLAKKNIIKNTIYISPKIKVSRNQYDQRCTRYLRRNYQIVLKDIKEDQINGEIYHVHEHGDTERPVSSLQVHILIQCNTNKISTGLFVRTWQDHSKFYMEKEKLKNIEVLLDHSHHHTDNDFSQKETDERPETKD